VRRLVVANGPNIFQMLLVLIIDVSQVRHRKCHYIKINFARLAYDLYR